MNQWGLIATEAQVSAMNAKLPVHIRIGLIMIDGVGYIPAEVIDSPTYGAIVADLRALLPAVEMPPLPTSED